MKPSTLARAADRAAATAPRTRDDRAFPSTNERETPETRCRAVPRALRDFFRRHEFGLLAAPVLLGAASSAAVAGMSEAAHLLQNLLFGVRPLVDVSAIDRIAP